MPAIYAKTEQVLTNLTPSWLDRLDAYAAAREVSRAEAVRRFIEDGLIAAERSVEMAVEGGQRP